MKIIRQSVFETNSSSSHSISINSESNIVLDTITPDEDGNILILGGEFGWDWFKHNDALTKARYCATNNTPHDVLRRVIKDHTQCNNVMIYVNWTSYDHYVDHDSMGICPIEYDEVKNFIFNKNSWLFGGNDNSNPPPNFYDVEEYDENGKPTPINYKYYLEIEGDSERERFLFKEEPTHEEIEDAVESILNNRALSKNGELVENRYYGKNFSYSPYMKPIDFETKKIFFIKENIWDDTREMEPQERNVFRQAELSKPDSPYVKELKYAIHPIIN